MAYIEVGQQNSGPIELHYHDHGQGQPVVLVHGWPLSERSWEKQEPVLLAQGYRVITYDRRGFGESSKPIDGYDYDTFAADLNTLMTQLDLRNAILVGFSMGTGEVARYLSTYGSERVDKAVIISGILPAPLKTAANPDGIDQEIFDDMMKSLADDRPGFLMKFLKDFYSHNALGSKSVSDEVVSFSWLLAAHASPIATLKCVSAWLEDFRPDLEKIRIPVLVIHGESDRILPIKSTGHRTRDLLPECTYVEIENGPHGILMSHADQVNAALSSFLASPSPQRTIEPEMRH